ncbi:MAG: MotA/TolQ/ExbB proton channel family protein [Bacteroidia bacterium]
MSNKQSQSNTQAIFAGLVFVLAILISIAIHVFVLGADGNFENNDPVKGHPHNILGIIYKGGFIVPILIAILLIVVTFTIERFMTIMKAQGKGNISSFIRNIRELISGGRLDEALSVCDRQKGSLANVVRSGLEKYKLVQNDASMDKEEKVAAIQKDLEEATALELPMLSKNLVILSTCASIATLIGLIGTVLGMIKSFQALANAGAPDSNALATGISEALINTALGITGSCIAIIFYNFFSSKIDSITYGIDEANFSIVQTFAGKQH